MSKKGRPGMPNKMRDDHHPAIENHGKHMKTSWKMGKKPELFLFHVFQRQINVRKICTLGMRPIEY